MPEHNEIPFVLQPSTVDNATFLSALTAHVPPEIDGIQPTYWATIFPGDPHTADRDAWRGKPIWKPFEPYLRSDGNTFFTISCFRAADGRVARSKRCFLALFVLVIDDVGTKIPWDRLRGHLVPSYILATSPGNCQVGYILAVPIYDQLEAEALIDGVCYQGLGADKDPGMLGVTRNVRLATGYNGKRDYRLDPASGFFLPLGLEHAPRHQLLHWAPDVAYTAEQIIADFDIDMAQARLGAGTEFQAAGNAEDDPWIEVWQLAGLVKGAVTSKPSGQWLEVTCPQVDQHTGGADNGSAYAAGPTGYRCHHGHCEDLDWPEVRRRFLSGEHGPEVQAAAASAYAQELLDGIEIPDVRPTEPSPRYSVDAGEMERWIMDTFEPREVITLSDQPLIDEAMRRMTASDPELDVVERGALLQLLKDRTKLGIGDLRTKYETARKAQERAWAEEDERRAVLSDGGTGRDSRGFLRRPYVGSRDWVRTDADGAPTVSAANIDLMLERAGAGVRFNEMSTCEVGSGVFTDMSMDQIVQVVHEWCVEFGLQGAQHNTVLKALRYIALENRFHPFEEFLKSIEGTWDGVDRIQQLCDLLPVEHPEMRDFLVRKWLYSIIGAARLMYLGIPGAQPRGVLVLSGQQYAGKTSLLQRLFSNLFPGSEKCFISGRHFSGSTDSRLELLGKLVVELGEIDSTTNKAEASLLKAFLSGEADRLRRPYALDHIEIQRRTVFAGSVNVNYLKDPSGNTRFWSLALTEKLPLDAISSLNMKQLWAQVDQQCLEKWPHRGNGSRCWTPWHLTDEEMAIVESANEPHRVLPVEEVWLEDVFDWADPEHKSLMERYRQGDSVAKAELLRLNPMTNLQIIQMAGEIGRRARSNEAFAAPIRKRLGINKMLTKAYTKDNGKRSSQTVWPMPPLTEQGKLMVTGVPIGTTLVQPDGARIH